MISELDKQILQKIITSNTHVSGAHLSQVCNVSINTIRKEIELINDFLDEHGCRIETKIAQGYSFTMHQPQLAKPFIKQLLQDIRRYKYLNLSEFSTAYYIVRRLLTVSKYLTVDALVDELYCSKSTVVRTLEKVKDYLALFDLKLKAKRNYGIYIDGNEWNKRLCLIYQHKIYVHSHDNEKPKESLFSSAFLMNTDYHNVIQDAILRALSAFPSISLTNIDLPKLCNYILLMKTRSDYREDLGLTAKQIHVAKSLETWPLAQHIYQLLPNYFREGMQELDLICLSILLACCRTICDLSQIPLPLAQAMMSETEAVTSAMKQRFDMTDLFDDDFYNHFSCYLYSLKIRILFGVPSDDEMIAPATRIGLFTTDLCSQFADYYYHKYDIHLKESDLIDAYYIINQSLYKNQTSFNRKRILVVSRYGLHFARNIALRIEEQFYKSLRTIQPIEYSDLYTMDCSDYDLIVSDLATSIPNVTLPIISISFDRKSSDMNGLQDYFNQQFKNYALLIFSKQNFHKKNLNDREAVLEMVYQLNQTHINDHHAFLQDIKRRENCVSFERNKGIVLMTSLQTKFKEPIFQVIVNHKPILWQSQRSSIFIYYHQGEGSKENVQLISYLLKQFIHQSESFLNLLYKRNYEEIIKHFQ